MKRILSGGEKLKNSKTFENSTILLIGAEGQLGREVSDFFVKKGMQISALSKFDLDIRDTVRIRDLLLKASFKYLINCAAYTNVDKAETDKELCLAINALSVKNLAEVCKDFGIELIHISTDFVFSSEEFREFEINDSYCPSNYYGLSKSIGESYILDTIPNSSYIIRTSWLYGKYGGNFMKAVTKKIMVGDYFDVVDDQFGQPTNTEDLVDLIYCITLGFLNPGIYHYASNGFASRLDWARRIEKFLYNSTTKISAVKSEITISEAKRPRYSILGLSSLNDCKVRLPGNWEEVLLIFLNSDRYKAKVL